MTSSRRVSEYQLDRLTVQELSVEEAQKLEQQIQEEAQLQQRMDEREQRFAQAEQREDFEAYFQSTLAKFQQLPTPDAVETDTVSSENERQSWWGSLSALFSQWQALGALAVAAAVVLIVVLPQLQPSSSSNTSSSGVEFIDGTGKGGDVKVRLLYLQKGQSNSRVAQTKLDLHPGDVIQFSYQVPHRSIHLMVVSLNQKGATAAVISSGKKSKLLRTGRGQFPSLELDHELGQERLFVLVSKKAFDWTTVQSKLNQAFQKVQGDLSKIKTLPGPWEVRSYWLHRRARQKP